MADLDFYIRPEDRAGIRRAVEAAGGVFRSTESGDEQFLFWDRIRVEFHGRLLYRKTKKGIENYPDWTFVDEEKNELTEEGYALNLLGHAVHDLAGSGSGNTVRSGSVDLPAYASPGAGLGGRGRQARSGRNP